MVVVPTTLQQLTANESDAAVNREMSGPNLRIPLPNGNIMKIPIASINISEEVDKTAIWKKMEEDNHKDDDDGSKRNNKYFGMSNKKHKNIKKKTSPKTDKRLTTMTEEEETLTRNEDGAGNKAAQN